MQPTQNTAMTADQPTRDPFGRPETDADRRRFDLREAGYLGPIDQDGHPTVSLWPNEPVPANVATMLRQTARYLSRYGWIQGCYYDCTSLVFTPAACMVGALGMVCYGGPCDAPAQMFDAPGFGEFEEALAYLDDFLTVGYGCTAYEFNDTKGRTAPQVIVELCRAAQMWEHVDAAPEHVGDPHTPGSRVNCPACLSECFCEMGIPEPCVSCAIAQQDGDDSGDAAEPVHADYPHTPGTLYDCPVCESECVCTRDFQCVHCALIAEDHADAYDTSGGAA